MDVCFVQCDFSLAAIILDNGFGTTIGESDYGVFYILYGLFVFIPGLAVLVRRLHDVGTSGWMILLALIPIVGSICLLVFLFLDSVPGDNQYGPNPKEHRFKSFYETAKKEEAQGNYSAALENYNQTLMYLLMDYPNLPHNQVNSYNTFLKTVEDKIEVMKKTSLSN